MSPSPSSILVILFACLAYTLSLPNVSNVFYTRDARCQECPSRTAVYTGRQNDQSRVAKNLLLLLLNDNTITLALEQMIY